MQILRINYPLNNWFSLTEVPRKYKMRNKKYAPKHTSEELAEAWG